MPQFLIDWQLWWTAFWAAHPLVFYIACAAGVSLSLYRKRRR